MPPDTTTHEPSLALADVAPVGADVTWGVGFLSGHYPGTDEAEELIAAMGVGITTAARPTA